MKTKSIALSALLVFSSHAAANSQTNPEYRPSGTKGILVSHPPGATPHAVVEGIPELSDVGDVDWLHSGVSAEDAVNGPGQEPVTDHKIGDVTYSVSFTYPSTPGSTPQVKGSALVRGKSHGEMENNHGYAIARAVGDAKATVPGAVAHVNESCEVAIAETGSAQVGANIILAGFGGGYNTTILAVASGKKTVKCHDSDVTLWVGGSAGAVSTNWEASTAVLAKKLVGQPEATASAYARVSAWGVIAFRVLDSKGNLIPGFPEDEDEDEEEGKPSGGTPATSGGGETPTDE